MSQQPSDRDAFLADTDQPPIEQTALAAFESDLEGVIESPSAGLGRLLKLKESEPVSLAELMTAGSWQIVRQSLRDNGFWRSEALDLTLANGDSVRVAIALHHASGGKPEMFAGVVQSVTERQTHDRPAGTVAADGADASTEAETSATKDFPPSNARSPMRWEQEGDVAVHTTKKFSLVSSSNVEGREAGQTENDEKHGDELREKAGELHLVRDTEADIAGSDTHRGVPCATEQTVRSDGENSQLYDPVTGLPNRILLHDRLGRAIVDRRGREGFDYAVLLVGLDRFRVVNDGLGYESGNTLLARVARRLEGSIRPMDTLARCGADEFVVLLHSVEGGDDAVRAALRLRQALEAPFEIDGRQIFVTASTGITLERAGAGTPDELLRQSAIALARAKSCGRGSYQIFGREMHEQAVTALKMEIDLRQALESGEFRVVYQPMISLHDRKLVGFEALVRWRNSAGEEVGPDAFIPLAEETGLIIALDRWVLGEACSRLAVWRTIPGFGDLTVSVNLSTRELGLPDLVNQVARSLEIAGLDPSALRLEITESAVMENPKAATRVLEQIRGLGVKLQLDDFGTGYSSLSQLHNLPIDALKIDRSFIRAMHDERGGLFIETIAVLAQHLGLSVVAEGIETREQLHGVEALGCDFAQGFLISRPLETSGVLGLLLDSEAMHATGWADHRSPVLDDDDTQLIVVPRAPLREGLRSNRREASEGEGVASPRPEARIATIG